MKIADLKVFPVGNWVFVKIETDEGVHGIGEASLSGRNTAVADTLQTHLKPLLIGRDATRIEHIWQDVFRGTFWRGGPVLQSALAGVDIALWDLNGKALGVPVYRLLGGLCRERVLLYRHIGGGPPEELAEQAQELLSEGWRVLRISPTDCPTEVFDAARATRRSVTHFEALRKHYSESQIVELTAVIATFGFLNRWNDTMATELEDEPRTFGAEHLAAHGWEPGKHV